jgi:hypothetical protein
VKLELSLSDRTILIHVLNGIEEQKGDTVRRIAFARRGLKARTLDEEIESAGLTPDRATWYELGEHKRELSMDRGDVEWLREKLDARDWAKPGGPQHSALIEAVYECAETLRAALAADKAS